MNKSRKLSLLNALFIMCIIVSNVMAVKLFQFGRFAVPAGVIAFPLSFLLTDVINEVWGREEATNTVKIGFIANIIGTALISLSVILPPFQYWEMQESYRAILGSVPRIMIAGLITYLISQTIDVQIFDRLKTKHEGKHLWIRNNVSTIISQLIDSFLFVSLAFVGTMPIESVLITALGQFIVKFVIALLDTPFCYMGVKWARK